jgi:hypothetical protein
MAFSRGLCVALATFLCSVFLVQEASAAKKRTVAGELKRLAKAEQITREEAAEHRSTYDEAKAKVKRLSGIRRTELAGVVKDLEGMAARGQFTASRLPALFLTLRRNIEWWSNQRLLRYGERVEFSGSELVFQYYAGHGIQIQWLGTFGKLNGLWSGGRRYDARAGALLDEALALAADRAGGIAWEYLFPFNGQSPPWVSSLAQGTGLQAIARTATRLNRQEEVFPIARKGLGIFKRKPPLGVRVKQGKGAHYLQYSGLPRLHILNGFIQSLVGLYDFAELTADKTARKLFEDGDAVARREVPRFDTGAWSLYSRGSASRESDLGYHTLLRDFLVSLCTRTEAKQYCSASENFTTYLTTPPEIEVLARTLRPRKTGELRFKLSKISRVSVTVRRGDNVVTTITPGTLSRGTKWVRWTPPKRQGIYSVTVSATDLAGNTASATGEVEVRKRP